MNGLRDQLIELHAAHGLDGVSQVPAFQELCAQHSENRGFEVTLNMVRDVLEALEIGMQQAPAQQVTQALLQIRHDYRLDQDRRATCRQLVLRRYAERYWTKEQRAYFEAKSEMAMWRPYFLSYTSHQDSTGEYLAINRDHMALLTRKLADGSCAPGELKRTNLLAKLVNRELQRRFGKGYYQPAHTGDPRDVEEKLRSEARQSLTFVQIIEAPMFSRWPSYCGVEFAAAAEDSDKALIFVMSTPRKDFESKYLVSVDYRHRTWHETVLRKEAFVLTRARTRSEVELAFESLVEHLIAHVENAMQSVFEVGVPA